MSWGQMVTISRMFETVTSSTTMAKSAGAGTLYIRAYRWMLLARTMDEKMAALYRGGKVHGGVYLGRGQEAVSVSIGISLRQGDLFAPLIRDRAGRLAFGEMLLDGIRTYLGSAKGPMRGRD